tara:strand:+ start:414 stop:806 length:393 start_codon:yes stop_codon:yes gene_type:complete
MIMIRNPADIDATDGFRVDGASPSNFLGFDLKNAGDVNGDGFDDIVIGAYFSCFQAIVTTEAEYSVGRDVAGIGDINVDGYDDSADTHGRADNGSVLVVFGSASFASTIKGDAGVNILTGNGGDNVIVAG